MSNFYVYALVDPRGGEPFYIGKGRGQRYAFHEREARGPKDSAKLRRIREIWAARLEVQIEMMGTGMDEADALRFERALIAELRPGLTNVTHGGGPLSVRPEMRRLAARIQAKCRKAFLARVPMLRAMLRAHGESPDPANNEVRHILKLLSWAAAA